MKPAAQADQAWRGSPVETNAVDPATFDAADPLVGKMADLDGDEVGCLVAKVAEIKRQK
jgi:hypothetical protein